MVDKLKVSDIWKFLYKYVIKMYDKELWGKDIHMLFFLKLFWEFLKWEWWALWRLICVLMGLRLLYFRYFDMSVVQAVS